VSESSTVVAAPEPELTLEQWAALPEDEPGKLRSLEILELGADGRYVRALGAAAERVEAVPGCAGLALDLPALWSEVEDLEREEPAADRVRDARAASPGAGSLRARGEVATRAPAVPPRAERGRGCGAYLDHRAHTR